MPQPFALGPSNEELLLLTNLLLDAAYGFDDLKKQRSAGQGQLEKMVRISGTLHRTSLLCGKLLSKAALSDAPTTLDGREAVALLRQLTEATTTAAARAADTISALAHDDTASAGGLLEQTRAPLSRAPSAVEPIRAALLRHDGLLYAQIRAAREGLSPGPKTVTISDAQRKGLASLARGDGVFRERYGIREVVSPLSAHVLPATVDALASKRLITVTPLPEHQDRFGLRLTTTGVQALLAASTRRVRSVTATTPAPARTNSAGPAVARR
ncbi:hypothetical protein [Streptomyces sp. NBC_00272]|uniref:hypothetical protein n=1 Tax=Streptomyces sp. NBC_00272 TaxID=2975698 RepID=UPI002E28929E|nr:hypothetical protein [Streptomyces sp. NBC_00272]